ncbi:MAG: chemotaxis signal transduction protein [Rhodocyclaceae bacterium]|nr:chemotaxis signal transduction protein [Rhodocyclaceae bacterium]
MGNLVQQSNSQPVPQLAAEVRQYLTFSLGGEMFAVGILNVKEIIEYGHLTEIPMMPAFIRGVINLRGAVVPVIDLSARFGGKPTEVGRRSCIIIIEIADGEATQDIGVLVDSVSAVLDIPDSDIEPPPAFGARIRTDFIEGMGKVAGKFVILLKVDQVLSVEEMSLLADVGNRLPVPAAGV